MFAMDTATLEVPENTAADMAIGVAFDEATDPDGDMLTYSLGGDDAESFDFDASTRQIKTMAPLDYETNNMYMVTVMATDPDGGYDSIMVTINVTDVNEAPMFEEDEATRMIAENSAAETAVGAPVTAMDPDGDTLAYALSGDDAMYFNIDNMGQITVGAGAMLDYETKMSYMVTVTATDPDGETDTIEVTINVTNVNEAPMFAEATADRSIDENSAEDMAVGDPVMAMDADGDTLTYTLSGADAMYFSIDAGTMLDYETKMSYMVPRLRLTAASMRTRRKTWPWATR
jgi:PKD repeat protein